MKSRRPQSSNTVTDAEMCILAEYLQMRDLLPTRLRNTTLPEPVEEGSWNEKANGVTLYLDLNGESHRAIENAVSRICLSRVAHSLPQWMTRNNDGDIVAGRPVKSVARKQEKLPKPQRLFQINWADSVPGISWLEQYNLTRIPRFNVYVVTASSDTSDALGYCDLAIGWFEVGRKQDLMNNIRDVLIAYWLASTEETDIAKWESFDASGLVERKAAELWARAVWVGQPPRALIGFTKITPLHSAIAANRLDHVKKILRPSDMLRYDHGLGMTPLHLAARHGSSAICAYLLEQGADAFVEDIFGKTPLEVARRFNRVAAAQSLETHTLKTPRPRSRNIRMTFEQ